MMKKNVFIINTARGPIINTNDLITFLEKGWFGGIGLDVYEFEKGIFFHDHRNSNIDPVLKKLLSFDNVLITGHQAFLTETALKNITETTLMNLNCFAQNKNCPNLL